MDQLEIHVKTLKTEKEVLSSKLEKLRKVSVRIPELEQEVKTLRESTKKIDRGKK